MPRAIVYANIFTYISGWLFNIVLVFCMGDPQELLSSPVGKPVRDIPSLSLLKRHFRVSRTS